MRLCDVIPNLTLPSRNWKLANSFQYQHYFVVTLSQIHVHLIGMVQDLMKNMVAGLRCKF